MPTQLSLANVITEVQALMNDPAGSIFTTALVTAWIKQGVTDVSTKTHCFEVSDPDAIPMANGILEYDITVSHPDCLKIHNAFLNTAAGAKPKGLMRIHPKQVYHVTSVESGEPEYWYEFGGKVGLYPIWATGVVRDKCGLHFSKATDVVTEIPDAYQPLVILFAAHKAKLMDGKPAQAAQYYQQYLNSALFQRQDLYDRVYDAKDDFKLPDRSQPVGRG
jgi:hypothetical protein